VRWYLRYSLSLRDVEELINERGLEADHTTVWRWVQRYGPELEQRLRRHLKPTNKSWRVDETYVRVKGRWCYLYRAIDSTGGTIDFLLSALRDAAAAKRLFRKALSDPSHPQHCTLGSECPKPCCRLAIFRMLTGRRMMLWHPLSLLRTLTCARLRGK